MCFQNENKAEQSNRRFGIFFNISFYLFIFAAYVFNKVFQGKFDVWFSLFFTCTTDNLMAFHGIFRTPCGWYHHIIATWFLYNRGSPNWSNQFANSLYSSVAWNFCVSDVWNSTKIVLKADLKNNCLCCSWKYR